MRRLRPTRLRPEPAAGGLEQNTLAHLIDDIERLREQLAIPAWGVVAGSWGALVAVAYAAAHPQRVRGLFLRSAFLGSDAEVARFFEPWPAWLGDTGLAWMGAAAHADPVALLQRAGHAPADRPLLPARVAMAWHAFEAAQARPGGVPAHSQERFKPAEPPTGPLQDALPPGLAVQQHYLQHHCFVAPGQVDRWLDGLQGSMQSRPIALVHGLADAVCHPNVTAALSARWPTASVRWVDGAGHDMDAPAMRLALTAAAHEWFTRLGR